MKTITLNNGIEMPMLGIGTFNLSPDQAEAMFTSWRPDFEGQK